MAIWNKGGRTNLIKPDGVDTAVVYFKDKSLKSVPKMDGKTTFGCDFYAQGMDYFVDCGGRSVAWNEVTMDASVRKVFRKVFHKTQMGRYPNTYFVDLWLLEKGIRGMWHINKENPAFLWVGSTLGVLLNLIVYMGYAKVIFASGDFGGHENYSRRLFLAEFNDISKEFGVECYNGVNGSVLGTIMPTVEM